MFIFTRHLCGLILKHNLYRQGTRCWFLWFKFCFRFTLQFWCYLPLTSSLTFYFNVSCYHCCNKCEYESMNLQTSYTIMSLYIVHCSSLASMASPTSCLDRSLAATALETLCRPSRACWLVTYSLRYLCKFSTTRSTARFLFSSSLQVEYILAKKKKVSDAGPGPSLCSAELLHFKKFYSSVKGNMIRNC